MQYLYNPKRVSDKKHTHLGNNNYNDPRNIKQAK